MKAVMYHYVRDFVPEFPYFKNLHVEDFKKQLDYFEKEYGFVSLPQFLECLHTGIVPDGVVLSFDDGLKDHYEYVLPILLERGLWGVFYVPTMPYSQGRILDVHKTHMLLGKFPAKEVYHQLLSILNESLLTHEHIREFRELTYSDQVDDDYTKLVKRTLNYFIGPQYRGQVLDQLMLHYFPDESRLLHSFYLLPEEIRALQESGMLLGSHTVSHPVLSTLSNNDQQKEIEESFSVLESITGKQSIKTFCYPYGGFHSFTPETERILQKNNCLFFL